MLEDTDSTFKRGVIVDLSTLVVSARIKLSWVAQVGMVTYPATLGLVMVLRPFPLMNLVVFRECGCVVFFLRLFTRLGLAAFRMERHNRGIDIVIERRI